MTIEESQYVKVLKWAYEKQAAGFTEEELFKNFGLDSSEGRAWYLKVFREHTLLIDFMGNSGRATLTAEGMSAAVNYLNLKEAQESGNQARNLAFWSIGIGIVVGIIQILLSCMQIYLELHK